MSRLVRGLLWFVVLAQATFALGFYFGLPFALALWPFNQTGHMSQVFIGSIFAAAAAATGWCLAAREQAGLTGIGLDYLAIFAPLAAYSLALGVLGGNLPVAAFGIIAFAGIAMGRGWSGWVGPRPSVTSGPRRDLFVWCLASSSWRS